MGLYIKKEKKKRGQDTRMGQGLGFSFELRGNQGIHREKATECSQLNVSPVELIYVCG